MFVNFTSGISAGGAYCNLRCKKWVADKSYAEEYPLALRGEMGDAAAVLFEKFKKQVDSDKVSDEQSRPDMQIDWSFDTSKKMAALDTINRGWAGIEDRLIIKRYVPNITTDEKTTSTDIVSDVLRKEFLEPQVKQIKALLRKEMTSSPIPVQVSSLMSSCLSLTIESTSY